MITALILAAGQGRRFGNTKQLMAWGENSSGQCNIPYGNNFVAIAAGMYHSLALRADGTVIATNDNWSTPVAPSTATAADLTAAFGSVGAFALTAGSRDAALIVTLPPGTYTAQVSGVNNTVGIAIVEVVRIVVSAQSGEDHDGAQQKQPAAHHAAGQIEQLNA